MPPHGKSFKNVIACREWNLLPAALRNRINEFVLASVRHAQGADTEAELSEAKRKLAVYIRNLLSKE